jgi:RNA-directed DNA polymerase
MPQDAPPNGDAPDQAPVGPGSRVAEMQAKLHRRAAADAGRRFDDLFNFVHHPATLIMAFGRVAGNQGANTPGVDGLTVAWVEEAIGVPGFLDDIRAQLKAGTFRPLPVRERKIPKPGRIGEGAEAWHPHHHRPGRPGGAKARAGTHLRGGLPARLLRVPADAAGA